MDLDPILLARIQFAFTIAFHILFPVFTIGLASWLAMLELLWLISGKPAYLSLYRFWLKVFAVSFGMGVVSGIVMSFQFGTNWSRFSEVTGNVLGPLLSYEVLTAFFLEASFLGIMLFGADRVGKGLHFFATCMVAAGTLISTFWIIAANSWMHTPAGFELRDGVFMVNDWMNIVFNPSFPYRLAHMVLAAYLTTCFVIGGVSAWYLAQERFQRRAQMMLRLSVIFASIVVPAQIIAGDLHGLNVRDHQPAKLAAIEAHWESQRGAPLILFALPDEQRETNRFEIRIPHLGSLILAHDWNGWVQGLASFPRDQRPPVAIPFFAFRVMVAIGVLMLIAAWWGLWLLWRGRLYDSKGLQRLFIALTPAGFIAVLAGWVTTEVGRQPYLVYGLMRTAEGVSPTVTAGGVATSLSLFSLVYLVVFGAGTYYIVRVLRHGPGKVVLDGEGVARQPMRPLSLPEDSLDETA
jgi:cytochrome d ubiquinol oxidase subunit I